MAMHDAHIIDRIRARLPAGPVIVTRHTRHYRRGVNGAWLGDAPSTSRHEVADPVALRQWTIGDSWLELEWPDGARESVHGPRNVVGSGYLLEPIGARATILFEGVRS